MIKAIFEKFSILYFGAHLKGPYFWSWNVHGEMAHQKPIWAQNLYIYQNLKISSYIITVLSDVNHTCGKVKVASLHVIEEGIYGPNQRQNILVGMPACQKYLKSEIDANCSIQHKVI
jgi:hypothetical protein